MKPISFFLVNVEKLTKDKSNNLKRCSQKAISNLSRIDDVKLVFKLKTPGFGGLDSEALWVQVEMIDGSGGFIGRIKDTPQLIEDLAPKDVIRFEECHILETTQDLKFPAKPSAGANYAALGLVSDTELPQITRESSMDTKSWHLTDVAAIAAKNKYTYFRSPEAAIASLKPGDDVKLAFALNTPPESGFNAEKMWVEVKAVDGSGNFTGSLENHPAVIEDLKQGDIVHFSAHHISNTSIDDEHPGEDLQSKYMPRCFVTNKVLQDGEKVGILYREIPDYPDDSGWRFLAGTETDEYMRNPENVQYVSQGAVLRCDDAFVELLDSPFGSRFELSPVTGKFEAVPYEDDDEEGEGNLEEPQH